LPTAAGDRVSPTACLDFPENVFEKINPQTMLPVKALPDSPYKIWQKITGAFGLNAPLPNGIWGMPAGF
jgi:hypothetical protein